MCSSDLVDAGGFQVSKAYILVCCVELQGMNEVDATDDILRMCQAEARQQRKRGESAKNCRKATSFSCWHVFLLNLGSSLCLSLQGITEQSL